MAPPLESASAGTPPVFGAHGVRMLSINHRTAPLGDLEHLAISVAKQAGLREGLGRQGIRAVVLCTCNRTEIYWYSRGPQDDIAAEAALLACVPPGAGPRRESFARAAGLAAARHLFRVAAGLESLVVGESEVLGQVREALRSAERDGAAGSFLSLLFGAALRFGGRVRTETGIGAGALSVASAAVRLLARVQEDLAGCTVLVIGAGTTGLKVARHLRAERVGRLVLINRTAQRAREAADETGHEAAPLEDLPQWLARADAVVAAVQTESALITADTLRTALALRHGRPLTLIDLSLPRAVDPGCAALRDVKLHDLSGLEQIVAHNRARRQREVSRVEEALERELGVFEARARAFAARRLFADLRRRAEAIRREELQRALEGGMADAGALDRVTRRLVDRLLLAPGEALQRGDPALDGQLALSLRALFRLARGDGDGHR